MKFYIKKRTLSRHHFAISAVLLVLITVLAVCYTLSVYYSKEDSKKEKLFKQGSRIVGEITLSFDYVSHLMHFLGKEILHKNPDDLQRIARLLQGRLVEDNKMRKEFSWAMFDWSTPDKKMQVSTAWGVIENPKNISHRFYAQAASKKAWKLFFDKTDIGISSGKRIIPAGMGIADDNGTLVGILSLGFEVEGLTRNVETVLDESGINFIMLDKDYDIAIQSSSNKTPFKSNYFAEILEGVELDATSGILPMPIEYNNALYTHYNKVMGYPYMILVGYDQDLSAEELKAMLSPGIFGYAGMGLFGLLLLYFLRRQIITPIMRLSNAAEAISQGNLQVYIPESGPREIEILANQLRHVVKYIKELQEVREELIKKTEAAESANRAKSEFLACMSHELRTPLNAVIAFSEILKEEMFGDLGNNKYREYVRDIYNSGTHLLSIINDILDLSKAEAGMITLKRSDVDINKVISECLQIVSEQRTKGNITLKIELPDDLPHLLLDELRLKQIIINLLSNAIKFTPEGGQVDVVAKVEYTDNKVSDLYITIEDTGIGMKPDDIPKAVEKFGQLDTGLNRKFEGTGLGLPLTKKLIEIHQGNLSIKSNLGQGTKVTIHFPLR